MSAVSRRLIGVCAIAASGIGCGDEAPGRASSSTVVPSSTAPLAPPRPSAKAGLADDPIIDVRSDDPAVVRARARAQAALDGVLERHLKSPLPGFSVKAPIIDGLHTEYVWLADVTYADGVFTGTIDNDPGRVKSKRAGDVIQAKKEQINDFMYEENGKIRGNFTARALLDRLPPEEAEAIRAELAPED